jgi:steroid delta-isomerase-like uncharacterized protein
MSTPRLVEAFDGRIWNDGEYGAIADWVAEDFLFRGSLGAELKGRLAFTEHVRSVRDALAEYRCEILACVTETDQAFAKMRFSERHVGPFRGYPPTGQIVQWPGAALFRFDDELIQDLWVLGDLSQLDAALKSNQAA